MYKLFKTSDIENIANAIREKTGKTDTMKIAEMPTEIESISGGGTSYTGHVDVAGLKAIGWDDDDIQYLQDNVWWNEDQDSAFILTEEEKAITQENTNIRFLPKSVKPTSFNNYKYLIATPIINWYTTNALFSSCNSLIVSPRVIVSRINYQTMYNVVYALRKIPLIDFSTVNRITSMLDGALNVVDVGGFKDLGKAYTSQTEYYNYYTLKLSENRYLTHDSLMNIINNLYDLRLNTRLSVDGVVQYRQSLVLGQYNIGKLTEEEKQIAIDKGWDIS